MSNAKLKQAFIFLLVIVLLVIFTACDPTATVQRTSVLAPTPSGQEVYNGPKATISMEPMGGIELIPVNWGGVSVAPELNSIFESALAATGRFRLVNRGRSLRSVTQEQDLAAAGRIRKGTEVKTGEITGSDLIVKARITGFSPGESGVGAALGTFGSFFGAGGAIIGAIAGQVRFSSLMLDVAVIDARTSETVVSITVEGNSTDLGGGLGGIGHVFGGVAAWKNTPMEKSLRVAVEKATGEITNKLPGEYFIH